MENIKKAIMYLESDQKENNRRCRKHPFSRVLSAITLIIMVYVIIHGKSNSASNNPFDKDSINNDVNISVSVVELSSLSNLSKVHIESASATSSLYTIDTAYDASKLIDGDLNTSWQDGADGFGENEELVFNIGGDKEINYIVIYNGNQISDEHYYNNNRLKDAALVINGVEKNITLPDSKEAQAIQVNCSSTISSIKIVIKSVYAGTVYDDTCISEVEFYK